MVSTPYLLLCHLTHKNNVPSGNLLPGWCLLAGRRLGRSHPSNGNISPLATYLLFLGFSILLQTHGSGPFVAGLGQAKDDRRERRSCCGKIFALPFSGIWTKSWDNRIQDFLSSLSFFFFLSSFACVCIPYCAAVFHVVCSILSSLWPGVLRDFMRQCVVLLLKINNAQRPLLYVTHCWFYLGLSGFGLF